MFMQFLIEYRGFKGGMRQEHYHLDRENVQRTKVDIYECLSVLYLLAS